MAKSEVEVLKEKLAETERERDAYKKAKQENDDRAAAKLAVAQEEITSLKDVVKGKTLGLAPFQDVLDERSRQNVKWGVQNHPDGTGPDVGGKGVSKALADNAKAITDREAKEGKLTWRHILMEEVAEAFAESDETRLRNELIQVAAVSVQWAEAIDRRRRG